MKVLRKVRNRFSKIWWFWFVWSGFVSTIVLIDNKSWLQCTKLYNSIFMYTYHIRTVICMLSLYHNTKCEAVFRTAAPPVSVTRPVTNTYNTANKRYWKNQKNKWPWINTKMMTNIPNCNIIKPGKHHHQRDDRVAGSSK